MKNILILTGRYLPGYKDGGPVRTLKNLTDSLGDNYHFTIVCTDRDHGDNKAYDGINVNAINHVGKADVYYVRDGRYSFSLIKKLALENDIIYVCGPYNGYAIKSLILNRLGQIKIPFVLAPMGSFSKGALAIKSTKKKIFLSFFKLFGLFNKVFFSVTSDVEEKELKEALGIKNKCYIAEDPQRAPESVVKHVNFKKDDCLNVVFLSRICEKKNLLGAISILKNCKSKIRFHIYGTMEDSIYYEKCVQELKKLPDNVLFEYKGEATSENVINVLSQYDVFLFPTFGENFGHVISESLLSGTIPVLSDTTPWLDLNEKKAGFVIPFYDSKKCFNENDFADCIDYISGLTLTDLKIMSDNCVKYYLEKYQQSVCDNGYVNMFEDLIK